MVVKAVRAPEGDFRDWQAVETWAAHIHLEVGDLLHDGPPGTAYFTVKALSPNRFLALYSTTHVRYGVPASLRNNPKLGIYGHFTWVFVLQESREHTTRLILRTRANVGPRLLRALMLPLLLPVGEIFTARRMLRGIKKRAEHAKGKTNRDGLSSLWSYRR